MNDFTVDWVGSFFWQKMQHFPRVSLHNDHLVSVDRSEIIYCSGQMRGVRPCCHFSHGPHSRDTCHSSSRALHMILFWSGLLQYPFLVLKTKKVKIAVKQDMSWSWRCRPTTHLYSVVRNRDWSTPSHIGPYTDSILVVLERRAASLKRLLNTGGRQLMTGQLFVALNSF